MRIHFIPARRADVGPDLLAQRTLERPRGHLGLVLAATAADDVVGNGLGHA
jgi:hypothetical protein